ncbi:MAG: acetoacetate--CoA ligase [Bacteroidetes bacterium]|nr:acetoacetate--CoA ligase [Bacteroidota bacterium]
MVSNTHSPKLLWSPSESFKKDSNLSHYLQWLKNQRGLSFGDYQSLWQWSVDFPANFWESLWDYFPIHSHTPYNQSLSSDSMPFSKWFQGATINYAEHIFKKENTDCPAIIFKSEISDIQEISWAELKEKVGAFQNFLANSGVKKGDRVAAFLPNIPEATIAFLAVNALGAIWSSTSPDFGTSSVVDRVAQISPKVLIAVDGYSYGGKYFSKTEVLEELSQSLPSLETIVVISTNISESSPSFSFVPWEEALSRKDKTITFEPVPFDHPIWILYSSGTTGVPKAITHGQGGVLLEHLKYLTFHNDVKPGDRCFWYTTTGWMMWNYIQASLLCGGTVVMYDGSPTYPTMDVLWQFAQDAKITHFGTSAGYIMANIKKDTHPGTDFDLSPLRSIGSTGSTLPSEGFDWIYQEVKEDLWLASISGGTDVCSAFVGGNPLWPVYSGEIQCRALGCKLEAYNESGEAVLDEVGEMVISQPMPSMPIYFWGDKDHERYKSSYFEMFPHKWRHGDWTKITPRNGVIIYGRSDATLNRGGIRIGTSEIYRAVDKIPEISDSMIICLEKEGGNFFMPLFVVPAEGVQLDDALIQKINQTIKNEYTPRHVPDQVIEVREIPYTISGKKVESPIKRILLGHNIDKVVNKDALKNPEAINFFVEYAKSQNR